MVRAFSYGLSIFLFAVAWTGCGSSGGTCGDGKVQAPEECDDGNKDDSDACLQTCKMARCGDNQVHVGMENCDDGNIVDGDQCPADCGFNSGPKVTMCPGADRAPLATGTCQVTAGDGQTLITATILTPGEVFRGGQVAIGTDGKIVCVGCDCAGQVAGATAIDCPTGVVSPGLINTHDHITFQGAPLPTDERYEHRHDWRSGKRGHTKITAPGSASKDKILWAELRFLMSGATSTVGSGSAAGLLRNLDKPNDQEGLAQKPVKFETFPLGDSDSTQLTMGCGYPGIDKNSDIANEDAYLPHVAEGIDAVARNEFLCVSSTMNGAEDLLEPQSAFIHSVGLTALDYAQMAAAGTALIWSPRSNVSLYGDTAQVTTAQKLGVLIALGTDWVYSGSMNMLRELRCADELNRTYYDRTFSDEQLWLMATYNGAQATATDDVIGSLKPGLVADIAIFNGANQSDHRAILDAQPADVVLVMRGGKVLYGDEPIVSALPTSGSCDEVDVCGTAKKACLDAEIGKSYSALKSAGGAAYADFFCGDPTSEPSCVPTRPTSVGGSTVYTGSTSTDDTDGDGIPNSGDNCPHVFNPVRPVDNGAQQDADGDNLGDPCDPCPLEADVTICKTVDPDDVDADGVPNMNDNCPSAPNSTQMDADSDGKGDACDSCPNTPNPGMNACPATIYQVKMGTVPMGSTVSIVNALVSSVGPRGFYLQAKSNDPFYNGPDFSGILVFTNSAPTVLVGDRVTLTTARVTSFHGQIELDSVSITVNASAGEAPPDAITEKSPGVPLTVDDIAPGGAKADAFDGVLVTVQSLQVSSVDAMAMRFVLDTKLTVGNQLFQIAPLPSVGENYASVTGVVRKFDATQEIEPRSAGDLVAGAPRLTGIAPAAAFVREGAMNASTLPASTPLTVTLSRAVTADTFVAIVPDQPGVLTVAGGGVTVTAGNSTAAVMVNGLMRSTTPVVLTATLGADMFTATVRVLDDGTLDAPQLAAITPPTASLKNGQSRMFEAILDLPAPTGGVMVTLSATAGMAPASVMILADELAGSFSYTHDTAPTSTITGTFGVMQSAVVTLRQNLVINEVDYDNVLSDNAEYVELFNPTAVAVDLNNLALVFITGSNSTEYRRVDLTGTLGAGEYLVVGSATVVVPGGVTKITFTAATDNIQNGNSGATEPDGIALLDKSDNTLVDAVSYEGSITAAMITGVTGTLSLVEGTQTTVADSNANVGSLCRTPNGSDTDNAMVDWAFCATLTPGATN